MTPRCEDVVKRLTPLSTLWLPVVVAAMVGAAPAHAQQPATNDPSSVTNVEVDPIRCWWRTSAGAVRIGEAFSLSLTCATLENESVQVVPDQSHLEATVIGLAPFEVISGDHPTDLHSGLRRFFQYHYNLRIINPDAIGKDIPVPIQIIHYKVNSKIAENMSLQGRDLTYVLPEQYVKVTSMVPAEARDIRDQVGEDFATVDALDLRAGTFEIAAVACVALGALMTLLVLVRLARGSRQRTPSDERVLSTRSMVSAAMKELQSVQSDREREGWTAGLAERAVAATRIVAAAAIGLPVSQRLTSSTVSNVGALQVPGPLRGKPRTLSSPVTPDKLAHFTPKRAESQVAVDELREALTTFSHVQYGREGKLDPSALDAALAAATTAAGRVKGEYSLFRTLVDQFKSARTPAPSHA
jgi:hypothetical protein